MATRPKRRFEAKKPEQGKHHAMYGAEWRKARLHFLADNPLCVECEKQGRTREATDVDHIVRHQGDLATFWDRDNWQGLCKECHAAKTVKERGGA